MTRTMKNIWLVKGVGNNSMKALNNLYSYKYIKLANVNKTKTLDKTSTTKVLKNKKLSKIDDFIKYLPNSLSFNIYNKEIQQIINKTLAPRLTS